jgi:hypothetical protein
MRSLVSMYPSLTAGGSIHGVLFETLGRHLSLVDSLVRIPFTPLFELGGSGYYSFQRSALQGFGENPMDGPGGYRSRASIPHSRLRLRRYGPGLILERSCLQA